MDQQILDSEELKPTHPPKIYSQGVIMGFSIFFSSFVGGILTSMNLNAVGKRTEANYVMIGTIIYFGLTIAFLTSVASTGRFISFLPNIIGGGILAYIVQERYIPNHKDLPSRHWWKPLIICIILLAAFVVTNIFLLSEE